MYLGVKLGSGGLHRAVAVNPCFRGERGYFRAVYKMLAGPFMVGLRKFHVLVNV